MSFSLPLTVVDAHLDNLGHVNNARYLEFLEEARTAWYGNVGLTDKCRAAGHTNPIDTVVVNVNIDFAQECLPGEVLQVTAAPIRAGSKSFTVQQTIYKASGNVAASATVTSVVMDLVSRRAIALPSTALALFADE
ncbi:MAG: acyl-CoA thioesterase [Chromatiales bacterium]|jgi:thioesterase III|nr:acyl-CoA thioesterase [Chromatiales bacterium]